MNLAFILLHLPKPAENTSENLIFNSFFKLSLFCQEIKGFTNKLIGLFKLLQKGYLYFSL